MEQIRNVQATELRLPFTERGALRLFVRADPYVTRLGGSIAVLLRLGGRVSSRPSGAAYFLRHSLSKRSGRSWGSLAGSLVLHSSLVALVAYLSPRVAAETHRIPASFPREIIYYRIPLQQAVKLPHLGAQPRGNDSSAAHHPDTPAALPPAPARATVATIFSRPAHPDNSHQTIYQSVAPPDLKIKTDQALPNVVALSSPEKPKFALAPQFSRPSAVDHSIDNVTSPTLSDVTSQVQLQVIAPASDSLLPAPSSPVARGPRQGPSADAADLVIISVDASNSAAELALPAGNRWGDFSNGPPKPAANGSDGSSSASSAATGVGSGTGGNAERRGGGGKNGGSDHGDAAIASPVAVGGTGTVGAANGVLTQLPPGMIYPVVEHPLNGIRKNTMVIAAGPTGGGGLRVYHALNCASIYSIFLPMPGKNWSLQYCEVVTGAKPAATNEVHPSVIHLDKPLLPPDVDLDHRFDFKRTPVPGPQANRLIILKGEIATDGSVQALSVYQGVSAELDRAAQAAFSQWHFKPAMRDGRAVAVQILVGIPPVTSE